MTGLAIVYNTNEILIAIPIIIPNSMEINRQAIKVQMKGIISTPNEQIREIERKNEQMSE